ncbi:MAG: motility-associated protein [Opitutales bacterium]
MLLIVGFLVVILSTLGGFMIAGGNPIVLLHLSEFVVIGGIAIGVLMIASPPSVVKALMGDIKGSISGHGAGKEDFMDLLKMLYEIFMIGRRNGLIALDEHVSDPKNSSIFQRYPSVSHEPERIQFLCNALRPIIDGKIKPDQLEDILDSEIDAKEEQAHGPVGVLNLVGDSLPGIGIVAAVLGIINTMGAIAEGPEMVGYKVAAALTGTFLGVFGAYGFINPLCKRISFNHRSHFQYFGVMSKSVSGFAKGLAPLMAIEIARRTLDSEMQPEADELEQILKSLGGAK